MVGSDFGRTNFYNEGEGKDHWPISSYLIMERDAPWGDRVVGLTDELHFGSPINQDTLKADRNGVIMTPSPCPQGALGISWARDFCSG